MVRREIGRKGKKCGIVGRVHRLTAAAQAGLAIPFLALGLVKLDEVRTTATAELGFTKDGFYAVPLDLSTMDVTTAEGDYLVRTARERVSQAAGVRSVSVVALVFSMPPARNRYTIDCAYFSYG